MANNAFEQLMLEVANLSMAKLLHTWIILFIVKQRLVQIGRIDGPAEYLS